MKISIKPVFLSLLLSLIAVFTCQTGLAWDESITFLHNDHRGSLIAATDEQGDVVWRTDYAAFGEPIVFSDEWDEGQDVRLIETSLDGVIRYFTDNNG